MIFIWLYLWDGTWEEYYLGDNRDRVGFEHKWQSESESGSLESWYSFHSFVTDIYGHAQCTVIINMSLIILALSVIISSVLYCSIYLESCSREE